MAKSASSKCCITCLIVIIVIILAVGITVGVVLNSTPTKLGFADEKISNEISLQELGAADLKLKDIIKGLIAIGNFNESNVITNPYADATASQEALSIFDKSNIKVDNQLNCSGVLAAKVVYDNRYLKTIKDTTLAFVLARAIEADSSSNMVNGIAFNVKEITISNKDTPHAKIVLKVANAAMGTSEQQTLEASILNSAVLCVDFDFDVDNNGLITTKNPKIWVNNGDKFITTVVNHLADDGLDTLKDKVITLFATMTSNMGAIGNAATDTNQVVQSTPSYGKNGVNNGTISFITYKAQ